MSEPRVLSSTEVAEKLARAEKATPGPWVWMTWPTSAFQIYARSHSPYQSVNTSKALSLPKDALFCVGARTDVPELVASHELLRAERDDLYVRNGEIALLRLNLETAQAEVERLRGLLEKEQAEVVRLLELFALIPHTIRCRSRLPMPFGEKARANFDSSCNCIKSQVDPLPAALADESSRVTAEEKEVKAESGSALQVDVPVDEK